MDIAFVNNLKQRRKGTTKKLYIIIAMLLVAVVMVTATTYAWLVMSAAPEAQNINTVVASNGNLEIALNTNDLLETELNGEESLPTGLNTFYERNVYWGNLLDLSDQRYGIQNVELKPALLNIVDQENNILNKDAPVQFAGYDASGRVVGLEASNGLATYDFDQQRFTGVLDYGIRAAGENYKGDGLEASVPPKAVSNTYAFCVDLLLRTNAEDANLLLQTKAIDRNNHDDGIPDEWYDDPAEDIKRGFGSNIKISNAKMRSAIRVAFTDTLTGEVYAIASADSKGDLHIIGDQYLGKIKALEQNKVTAITVWIYLDGNQVENIHASSLTARDLEINIQFRTDVELKPAHGTTDKTYDDDASDEAGTGSDDYEPVAGTFYFDANQDELEYYVLDETGNRVYEVEFEGTVNTNTRKIVIDSLGAVDNSTLQIPAILTDVISGGKYAVSLKTDKPIRNAPAELHFLSVGGAKVALSGTQTGDLLGDNRQQYLKIDMSGLNTSNIQDMSHMFDNCLNLEELNISQLDTSKVESMSYMFNECRFLKTLDVSNFDTSNVTDMSAMFAACHDLSGIDLSNFDTANVTDMSYMFSNCYEFGELDVSSFVTSNVTDMGHMFANCRYLKKLIVGPGWDRSNANVWYMYYDTKLEVYP